MLLAVAGGFTEEIHFDNEGQGTSSDVSGLRAKGREDLVHLSLL